MNSSTDTAPCDHLPTLVVAEHTAHGFRVRCLQCGEVGPERECPGAAFVALRQQRRDDLLKRLRR